MEPMDGHERGDRLVREGKTREAIAAYLEAIRAYGEAGQLLKAIAVGKLVLQLDPADAAVRPLLGQILLDDFPPIPLFSDLPRPALVELVQRAPLRAFDAGEAIVKEGEPGASMFVLVKGRVNVLVGGAEVAAMPEGTFFGEIALISDAPRLATVTSEGETLLIEVERRALEEVERAHPGVVPIVEAFYRDRLLANLMRVNGLFQVPEEHKASIAARFALRTVDPGTILLREGGTGDGMYVILRGSCEVFWHVGDADRHAPAMREGDVFGEISLLSEGRATATVRATSRCVLLYLSVDDFRDHVMTFPSVREHLGRLGHERLHRTTASQQAVAAPDEIILSDYLV
jgi:CRP-like cAMP-binding protein